MFVFWFRNNVLISFTIIIYQKPFDFHQVTVSTIFYMSYILFDIHNCFLPNVFPYLPQTFIFKTINFSRALIYFPLKEKVATKAIFHLCSATNRVPLCQTITTCLFYFLSKLQQRPLQFLQHFIQNSTKQRMPQSKH